MAAIEDDLSPGRYNFTRTRGDTMTPTVFSALTFNGAQWEPDEVRAQVKATVDHTAEVVLDLEATVSSDEVTVGDGLDLGDIEAGTYYWDCEVFDDAHPSGFTILAGRFTVLPDVTEEEEGS